MKDLKNILIADNSTFFRIRLGDMLLKAGYRVRLAKNGKEAIDEIKRDPGIDLLVLDLHLPDLGGLDVLNWIGDNGRKGKFPILTTTSAYGSDPVIGSLKNLGVTGFMQKDLSNEHILLNINDILASDGIAEECREKGRVLVYLPVNFLIKNTKYSGSLINLSETGASLYTSTELPKETKIDLEFSMNEKRGRDIKTEGTVKWSTKMDRNRALLYRYGIMFSAMAKKYKDALRDFITVIGALPDTHNPGDDR